LADSDREIVLAKITEVPIIPIVTTSSVDNGFRVATALRTGGLRSIEVTLRSSSGLGAITKIRERTDLLIGAGTVRSPDDVIAAKAAGAHFLVSPGITPDLAMAAQDSEILLVPGVASPSELMLALSLGLTHVKVFPIAQLGGSSYLRALAGPFSDARFMPSGGVTLESAVEFMRLPHVFAVGGGWMLPKSANDRGGIGEIEGSVHQIVTTIMSQ
jgi:2-dehydro-3-deoxyphosphogluconate aldolase/(4S)-4-hydroxy-2-oxoglutarate aldolase